MLSISTTDGVTREENTITQAYQIEIQGCLYTRIAHNHSYKIKADGKLVVRKVVYIMGELHDLGDVYITDKKVKATLKDILEKVGLI